MEVTATKSSQKQVKSRTAMTVITNALVAVLIIGAILALMFVLWQIANETENVMERAVRIMAYGGGLLTVLGTKAGGISISRSRISQSRRLSSPTRSK